MALRDGDSVAATVLMPEVTDLAASFDFAEHLVGAYAGVEADLAAGATLYGLPPTTSQAAGFAADVVEQSYFAFEKWAEAGRLAAAAGDTRCFSQRALGNFAPDGRELSSVARATLARIADRLQAGEGDADLAALSRDFATLISQLGYLQQLNSSSMAAPVTANAAPSRGAP